MSASIDLRGTSVPSETPCGLRGVTYSEFDNKVGPRLKFQYPANAITSEEFESFAEYVIVGKHLCGKIITVRGEGLQFVNYSVAIDNPKYDRNTLLFAVGFVLDKDIDTRPFEPVLAKVATNLVTVERESEYLFKEETKQSLAHLLETLYVGLISRREVTYCLNDCNMLNVKLYSSMHSSSISLRDYDVPVMVFQDVRSLCLLRWDISVSRVLHWIDGTSCVRKISDDADMDIECVKRCLRILHLYGCVIITGIFQFSNEYMLSWADMGGLLDSALLRDVRLFSAVPSQPGAAGEEGGDSAGVVRFLCSFRPGRTIGELLLKHKYILQLYDIRRLVAICQHYGIIRRIHKHPILLADNVEFIPGDETAYVFTGSATLESICFTMETTVKDVLENMKPCLISK